MIVDLQIDADTFCKSFREQMRKALACQLREGEFDIDRNDAVPGTRYVITGYTVATTQLRRPEKQTSVCIHSGAPNVVTHRPVRIPQVVQDLVVHLAWEADLSAANTHKAPQLDLHLPLVFDLSMETCGDMRRLCFHYVGLDGVDQAMAVELGQNIASTCTFLPVDRIVGAYMPADVPLVNAHLTMTESHKCLAVRMEFWSASWGASTGDSPRPLAEWEQFYAGRVVDRLSRGAVRDGWNVFLDQRALTHVVRKMLLDGLTGTKGLTITRQPTAVWRSWYPVQWMPANRVRVDLEVEQEDACWCLTEDQDVNATVTADVVISVPAEDTLRIDVHVDVDLDDLEAACCILTAAAFWPALGLGQTIKGKVKPGAYWLGFLPFAALIGAILAMDDATSQFQAPGGFVTDPDDGTHAYQVQRLALPNDPGFGKMTLRGASPIDDAVTLRASGMALYGGLEVRSPPQPVLADPQLEAFCWGAASRCSRRVGASSRFRLDPVNPGHWALLSVCEVRVIDDPLNVFKVAVVQEPHGLPDVVVTVDFWAMKAGYWMHPYPCRLMVKTTGGVRILTLPPLPALTEQQFSDLYMGIQLQFVNNCYLPRHRLFEELEWPIEVLVEQPGLHHWQVRAVGLAPGEVVQLVDRRDREIGRFAVNGNGTLIVDALATVDAPEPVLMLKRTNRRVPAAVPVVAPMIRSSASPTPICGPEASGSAVDMTRIRDIRFPDLVAEHADADREVVIRDAVLVERAAVRLDEPCTALSLDADDGWPRLVAITDARVEAFDLSDASTPRRADAWRVEGAAGAVAFGGRLVLWGRPGLWVAGDAPPAPVPFTRCDPVAVRGAAVVDGRLMVLGAGELRVYDPDLCEVDRFPCDADQIAAAGRGALALLDRDGLRFLGTPDRRVESCGRRITHIWTAPVGAGAPLYARTPEGGILLSRQGEQVATFAGPAWFEGVVRAGRLLAFPDGPLVRLVEVATSLQSE